MLLKFLLKIWPALLPITLYILWFLVIEKIILKLFRIRHKKIIEGEFKIVGERATEEQKNNFGNDFLKKKPNHFSLHNPWFVGVLYVSLIMAISSLIFIAFH